MTITLNEVTLEYKVFPVTLNDDGTGVVTLRKGYYESGNFLATAIENYYATKEEVSAILDVVGSGTLTRREDFTAALYNFCVSKGAQAGVIT